MDALPQRLKPIIFGQVNAALKRCSTQKRLRGVPTFDCFVPVWGMRGFCVPDWFELRLLGEQQVRTAPHNPKEGLYGPPWGKGRSALASRPASPLPQLLPSRHQPLHRPSARKASLMETALTV